MLRYMGNEKQSFTFSLRNVSKFSSNRLRWKIRLSDSWDMHCLLDMVTRGPSSSHLKSSMHSLSTNRARECSRPLAPFTCMDRHTKASSCSLTVSLADELLGTGTETMLPSEDMSCCGAGSWRCMMLHILPPKAFFTKSPTPIEDGEEGAMLTDPFPTFLSLSLSNRASTEAEDGAEGCSDKVEAVEEEEAASAGSAGVSRMLCCALSLSQSTWMNSCASCCCSTFTGLSPDSSL